MSSSPGSRAVAEDLTAETFLAAVRAHLDGPGPISAAWLIGTARHKLVDHWRRLAREERSLRLVDGEGAVEDPWDVQLDAIRAQQVLDGLAPQHRAVLTLRYLDDLPVPQVAALLGRTVHATEAPSCGVPRNGPTPIPASPRNCVPASHVRSFRPRPEDPQ